MTNLPGMGFLGGGGVLPIIEYTDNRGNTGAGASPAYSNVAIGTPGPNRMIIVAAMTRNGSAAVLNSVTVGGVSLGIAVVNAINSVCFMYLRCGIITAGATANIIANWSASLNRSAISVWAAYNLLSTTPFSTDTDVSGDPVTLSALNMPARGVAMAAALVNASSTFSWTGFAEDYDASVDSFLSHSGGSLMSAAAITPAVSCNPTVATNPVLCGASWG